MKMNLSLNKLNLLTLLFFIAVPATMRAHEGHSHSPPSTASVSSETLAPAKIETNELKMFLEQIRKLEYLHVLINPIPIYGMAVGALLLLGANLRRSKDGQITALVLLALVGGITWIVVEVGQDAYDRMRPLLDLESQAWLKTHMDRAENLEFLFYGTSALAVASLVTIKKGKSAAKVLTALTLIFAFASLFAGGWIGHAGGVVRHTEFRNGVAGTPH